MTDQQFGATATRYARSNNALHTGIDPWLVAAIVTKYAGKTFDRLNPPDSS